MSTAAAKPVKLCLASAVVIPARLASTRLPRKMLLAETGKPLVVHTYERALLAARPMSVTVAADAEEIAEAVRTFGGRAVLTSPQAASGTDRVAEVARQMPEADVLVNVQGDEPEISPAAIDLAIELLERNPAAVMSTLAAPLRERHKLDNPACVKVVLDDAGRALYFSRSAIPHVRDWDDRLLADEQPHFFQHIGLYAYRRDFLLQLAGLPRCDLEKLENLEQLRVLAAGYSIQVGIVERASAGIDTPEDYRAFVSRWGGC
jgi:3-deoxy-manno-octulosonate cytidylyltransferase (CMP-KDO synthetase)